MRHAPIDSRDRSALQRHADATGMTLQYGRERKRWAQRVALILYVVAGLIFFVAWAIMLAYLILLLTY
jgi:hypothetical protein